ncbi:glycoside hydrolase family 26 protein [Streptomyces sp. NBC_00083]|uniref:glycoside hydrolase family 26 protein n=1 Tax=Streptomyces sp. NBC_00083 TaxID=2975647 RepID=UPI002250BC69|nr:glycosyl hydrolase [Streptomyces sp. NBC_00083]MCX5384932.1 glycoside hydrolase family 26 protein [Streptomyces sp. NBC_00083]
MRRRTAIFSGGAAVAAALGYAGIEASGAGSKAVTRPAPVGRDLGRRDPAASPAARAVFAMLADLENDARAGRTTKTVIGQHVELHNELYNPDYGDYRGMKPPGYYYRKAWDITGKFPGFVEIDLGPGYGQQGWGVDRPRPYSAAWPNHRKNWAYTDDAVDLAVGVWSGLPRAADGTYNTDGREPRSDGSASALPSNGGRPAGLVGMSFHQPWPGSPVKGYDETKRRNSPAVRDGDWIRRLLTPGTADHGALLHDLSFVADHLAYLAAHDVPVLFRPYHEMNAGAQEGFWWSALAPDQYTRLWRTLYDYLVGTRNLHNLIFVWSPNAWDHIHGSEPWDYYPGEKYVDVVGVDDYSGSPQQPFDGGVWTKRWYDGLADYGKPRMMAESFHVPVNSAQPHTLDTTPWVLWTVWGQGLTQHNVTAPQGLNTPADVKATYNSPRTLTAGPGGDGQRWLALRQR